MRLYLAIAYKAYLLLRRDKIFAPVLFASLVMFGFAHLVSAWTIAEYRKILSDFCALTLLLGGHGMAIFWGSQSLGFSSSRATLELELAGPLSRSLWLIGRWSGLAAVLSLFNLWLLVFWQLLMLAQGLGVLEWQEVGMFAYHLGGWLVMAALALCFACFCSPMVAVFASFSSWIAGLIGPLLVSAHELGEGGSRLGKKLAQAWDLQRFNAIPEQVGPWQEGLWLLVYGACLIGVFLALACWSLQGRDIKG